MSAENNWSLRWWKYLNDFNLLLQTWLFSLCRKPGSALSPPSTPETSLVLTRYWLLCSSACNASTSAQSRRHARGLVHQRPSTAWSNSPSEEWLIRQRDFNGFKLGTASVVFAACIAISVPFGQNRVLSSITGNVSLFRSIARETALL